MNDRKCQGTRWIFQESVESHPSVSHGVQVARERVDDDEDIKTWLTSADSVAPELGLGWTGS